MGEGGPQARIAGQARTGARHPPEHLLAARPTPWTPWSLSKPTGVEAQGARSQEPIRQDQTGAARLCAVAWTGRLCSRRLAREANFAPALTLVTHRAPVAGPRSRRPSTRASSSNSPRFRALRKIPRNPMGRATRAAAAVRERQLRPYLERSAKARAAGLRPLRRRPQDLLRRHAADARRARRQCRAHRSAAHARCRSGDRSTITVTPPGWARSTARSTIPAPPAPMSRPFSNARGQRRSTSKPTGASFGSNAVKANSGRSG